MEFDGSETGKAGPIFCKPKISFSLIIRIRTATTKLMQLGRRPITSDEESQKFILNGIANGTGKNTTKLSRAETAPKSAALQDGKDKANPQKAAAAITKIRANHQLLPEYPVLVFGPHYKGHESSMADKDRSFHHMLEKTNPETEAKAIAANEQEMAMVANEMEPMAKAANEQEHMTMAANETEPPAMAANKNEHVAVAEKEKELMAIAAYKGAVNGVLEEAKKLYGLDKEFRSTEFQEMMIIDGCFFLRLAVLILGCGNELENPTGDTLLGQKPNDKDKKQWIGSMFFVGNQIPIVVLDALINQKFFTSAMEKIRKLPAPESSLCEKLLYDLLTNQAFRQNGPMKPIDCLHALHERIMGPNDSGKTSRTLLESAGSDDQIAEENNDFLGLGDKRKNSTTDGKLIMFPSVTELKASSIRIRKLKSGLGVRSIKFKNWYFWAFLYLPEFPTNDEAEMIFSSLTCYENSHLEGKGWEVCSYVRFMSDLVQTRKDSKMLGKLKIITVPENDDKDYVDKLPKILEKLCDQNTSLTSDFRSLRRQILDYTGPPWSRIESILNWVAVLTLVQTVITVLSYFHPKQ